MGRYNKSTMPVNAENIFIAHHGWVYIYIYILFYFVLLQVIAVQVQCGIMTDGQFLKKTFFRWNRRLLLPIIFIFYIPKLKL